MKLAVDGGEVCFGYELRVACRAVSCVGLKSKTLSSAHAVHMVKY